MGFKRIASRKAFTASVILYWLSVNWKSPFAALAYQEWSEPLVTL